MTDSASLDAFLDKWRAQWPEWAVAEAFVPQAQRERAQAWFALRDELMEAAWGGDDPTPGAAKLLWWEEELAGWSRGARRHPLGLALQKVPAHWDVLAASLPALRASRGTGRVADAHAQALTAIEADLFADGGRITRIHAALEHARQQRTAAGKPLPLPRFSTLFTAWRAARG
ncbi:MAG: phytoene/squalene synthase family protein [Thermomonas sp.]|uniref:phytoene/squalene synthase family protein n=1 Tax=Thermomonas sp. TaxID=1971895 RepID=UPI0039E3AB78